MPSPLRLDELSSLLMSVDQTLDALPVRKSRRWLIEFLHRTKTDPVGRPLYRQVGRDKLIYIARLLEAFPCPSTPFQQRAERSREARLRGWNEAAALLNMDVKKIDDKFALTSRRGNRGDVDKNRP